MLREMTHSKRPQLLKMTTTDSKWLWVLSNISWITHFFQKSRNKTKILPDSLEIRFENCRIFMRIFWSRSQVCPRIPTYSNAHANVKTWIFWGSVSRKLVRVWFLCKWFLKLFNLSYADFSFQANAQNPKIPGIQPNDTFSCTIISGRQIWCTLD